MLWVYPGCSDVARGSLDGVVARDRLVSARPATREPAPVIFTATAAYTYADRDRATVGLRGQLREIVAGAGAGLPDWWTFVVEGPVEVEGLHGLVWFIWTATVERSVS